MKADQWMPLYVGDYLADTGHLSCEGHGAYLLLLMHQWRTGFVPADPAEQARIVRLSGKAWRALSPSLAEFFTVTERGWVQARLERTRQEHIEKIQRLSDRARAAGVASAAARKPNSSSTQAGLKPTQPEPEPDKNKTPSPSKNEGEGEGNSPGGEPPAPLPSLSGKETPPEDGDGKVKAKPPHPPMSVLEEMAAVWNDVVADHGLAQVREITEQRAIHLRARCRERWTQDPVRQFRAYVKRIVSSPFLRGENDRDWKADFDWAIKPANVVKVAEGKYHDGEGE